MIHAAGKALIGTGRKRTKCDRCSKPTACGGSSYLCGRCYEDLGVRSPSAAGRERSWLANGFLMMGIDEDGNNV